MPGEIKHEWNGTILTITSDSGTTSMDLKGGIGDLGPRGPQGPAGVIYDEDGVVLADNLVTSDYVDAVLENLPPPEVDLSDYATKDYVDERVVEAASGGSITLNNYATKEYADTAATNAVSQLDDTIEDYVRASMYNIGDPVSIVYAHGTNLKDTERVPLRAPIVPGKTYRFKLVYSNNSVEEFYTSNYTIYPPVEGDGSWPLSFGYVGQKVGFFIYSRYQGVEHIAAVSASYAQYVKELLIDVVLGPITIAPSAFPIDNDTMVFDENNKISANIPDFATKEYVINQIANVNAGNNPPLEDVYVTKEELKNNYYDKDMFYELLRSATANIPIYNNAEEMTF